MLDVSCIEGMEIVEEELSASGTVAATDTLGARRVSIERRLRGLEKAASEALAEPEPPWASSEVYARLREDAQDSIDSDLAIGEKPLYWIDGEGDIRAADDNSFVRHL